MVVVPSPSSAAIIHSEPPRQYPISRTRSNNLYNQSQFAATTIPIGMASKPINIHNPYWTYQAYWPYRYFRNYRNYENYITDSFYWHYPFRIWNSYRGNWYHYDSPYFYRRYHDNYNVYYNAELMSYGNRSKLIENLYQETPITQ
ncbi:hypothetical protein ACQ4LE_011190 [Meloidogyne hapla]